MASPTRTRTRLARHERRDQIVEAAGAVLRVRDPAEVTFEEIADAAGVSRALLYNYFGDRQGLLDAVEERTVTQLDDEVALALVGLTEADAVLAAYVDAHLAAVRRDPAGYRLVAAASLRGRPLGPLSSGDQPLVSIGAMAGVQAMVLAADENGALDDPETAAVINRFLEGALAAQRFS